MIEEEVVPWAALTAISNRIFQSSGSLVALLLPVAQT